MKAQRFEARATLRVTPEALWPLVADTPRLNRALGLPPIEYHVTPAAGGGSHIEAQVRMLGLPVARWTEHPFRWEAPRGYVVLREFHGGPIERIRGGVQLTPGDDGTEVLVHAEIAPRNPLGALLARKALGPRSVQAILKQCRLFERYLLGELPDPFPQLAGKRKLPPRAEGVAIQLSQQGLDQRAVERLRQHLAEARDDDVVKMRPFELADRWGFDRRETLALFLHATVAGLLTMSWDVLCPNCRVGQSEVSTLRDLAPQAHCGACNVTFDARFDRLVEVRFTVAPALRRVENRQFCIGGPMNTPHIAAQSAVDPGAVERLQCRLAPGRYRLRVAPLGSVMVVEAGEQRREPDPTPGPSPRRGGVQENSPPRAGEGPGVGSGAHLPLTLTPRGLDTAAVDVPAGPLVLDVRNETDRPQLVVLEGDVWPDTVTTAAMVSTMPEFRDLFSSEVLAPGLQLAVENLAFMFTDLTGSTALYQAIGQARAFRLVQDHFRLLEAAIRANRGALVKTIGDAVMATFASGADALGAALQIQRDIRHLAAPDGVDTARLVKIGLHQGPCVAVTLNDRLDYFGTTVNAAARIEHECRGGQVVASLAACQSEQARRLLQQSGAVEEELVHLRGLAEPVPVYRVKGEG